MHSYKLNVLLVVPPGFGSDECCLNPIKSTDWTRIIVDLKSSHVTFSSRKKIFFIQGLQFTFITVNELCIRRQISSDSFSFSSLHACFCCLLRNRSQCHSGRAHPGGSKLRRVMRVVMMMEQSAPWTGTVSLSLSLSLSFCLSLCHTFKLAWQGFVLAFSTSHMLKQLSTHSSLRACNKCS